MVNTILTMKVRNTMQTHSSKTRIVILTVFSLVLEGCSISDWYNGYYVERSSSISFDKKSDAYYDAESAQMKELRKNNDAYCTELAEKPENREARAGFPNGVFNDGMYSICMEKRGTPTFETYQSNQSKKEKAERRARGEIVL